MLYEHSYEFAKSIHEERIRQAEQARLLRIAQAAAKSGAKQKGFSAFRFNWGAISKNGVFQASPSKSQC